LVSWQPHEEGSSLVGHSRQDITSY
jgi:hypothetical protein